MAEKTIIVNGEAEIKTDKKGREYLSVPYGDGKHQAIYGNSELWEIVQNSAILKMTGTVSGNFFNVDSFLLDLPPADKPISPTLQAKESSPERGMWWKELGEMIRSGTLEKEYPHDHAKIKIHYWKEMFATLDIKK